MIHNPAIEKPAFLIRSLRAMDVFTWLQEKPAFIRTDREAKRLGRDLGTAIEVMHHDPIHYPLFNIQKRWKNTIFNGKTHYF